MSLKVKEIVWALYVHETQYVASFKSREDAVSFANTYYRTCNWHIEPRVIYTFKK